MLTPDRFFSGKTVKIILVAFIVVLLFFPFGLFLHAYARVYKRLPEVERTYHPELGTVILDVKGRTISELFHERRSYVILGDIPRPVVLAFLAA